MDNTTDRWFNSVMDAVPPKDLGPRWLRRLRRRALALGVAIALMAWGAITFAALPVWPVVGVAVAALAVGVNSITARMREAVCLECGGPLKGRPAGEYGVICPGCGSLNEHVSEA